MTGIVTIADMSLIVERNILSVIGVNAGSADTRTAKVTSNIFHETFEVFITSQVLRGRSSTDDKPVWVFKSEGFFNRREVWNVIAKFFQKNILKSNGEQPIVNVGTFIPDTPFNQATLSSEAMDMRIPIRGSGESMEDTDHAGGERTLKAISYDDFISIIGSREKEVKQGTIFQEIVAKRFG